MQNLQDNSQKNSKPKQYKLRLKSVREKQIIDQYYNEHKTQWDRKDLKSLSRKTGLKMEQVYKYLWNKRNNDKKMTENMDENSEVNYEQQVKKLEKTFLKQEQSQQVYNDQFSLEGFRQINIGKKSSISVPKNLLFAKEFFIPKKIEMPSAALDLLSQFGITLTLQL